MPRKECFAPVFEKQSSIVCLLLVLTLPFVALAFLIALIVGALLGLLFPDVIERIVCNYKRYLFRVKNCQKGNDNPNIKL